MKACRLSAWLLVVAGLAGCDGDSVCEPDPAGRYTIQFNRSAVACTLDELDKVPVDVLVTDESEHFSSDGCVLTFRGCSEGETFCGELHWVEPGVYEGDLTYVHFPPDMARADCLIHWEEAELTLEERDPAE